MTALPSPTRTEPGRPGDVELLDALHDIWWGHRTSLGPGAVRTASNWGRVMKRPPQTIMLVIGEITAIEWYALHNKQPYPGQKYRAWLEDGAIDVVILHQHRP